MSDISAPLLYAREAYIHVGELDHERFVEGASSGRNNQRAMPAVISSSRGAAEIAAGSRLPGYEHPEISGVHSHYRGRSKR